MARKLQRQEKPHETAGTTGDIEYSDMDCKRPLETMETTRDCRNHLDLKYSVIDVCKDIGDYRRLQGPLGLKVQQRILLEISRDNCY